MHIHGAGGSHGPTNTTIWFEPRRAGFRVMNSVNVVVSDLIIDHNPLPYDDPICSQLFYSFLSFRYTVSRSMG